MDAQAYLKHKTRWEILLWVSFIVLQVSANALVVSIDLSASGIAWWKPLTWEISSALTIALLVPVIIAFDKKFPLTLRTIKHTLPAHILFTVPFSIVHVVVMVAIRHIVYMQMNTQYDFGDWSSALFYEYLKDFRTYFTLLSIIYLYRFFLFRLQGEASILEASDSTPKTEPVPDDSQVQTQTDEVEHLLVKKLGKEFLIKVNQISWLEACGNYVNLHLDGRIYPYRGTMKSLADMLDTKDFIRVHRSYIVNYSQIKSIEPQDSGDAKIELEEGKVLPFSRRYRAEFKQKADAK